MSAITCARRMRKNTCEVVSVLQEQGTRGDPVHEKKHQPRKYEDTTSSLLKRNTSSGNPRLTMRFLISLI